MREREAKPRGLRLKRKLGLVLLLCVLLGAVFLGGAAYGGREKPPVISSDLLGEQLRSVQELVSVEYHYTNMGKFENQVDFYGWKVPFTTKSFLVSYDGFIKAGVDLSTAQAAVSGDTVTVTLPAAKILSHEIPEDSIEVFDESHNIFNPIKIEDYTGFTKTEKQSVEQKAIEKGLLVSADEKARAAVEALLTVLPGMDGYTLTVRAEP